MKTNIVTCRSCIKNNYGTPYGTHICPMIEMDEDVYQYISECMFIRKLDTIIRSPNITKKEEQFIERLIKESQSNAQHLQSQL